MSNEKNAAIEPTKDVAVLPSNEVIVNNEMGLERGAWQLMKDQAQVFMASDALPKSMDNVPKVIMALQAGREIGLKPIESLSSFYFVNGKISLYGPAAIKLVLQAGHKIEWGECNDKEASVTITRADNGSAHSAKFTIEQAKSRGMAGKDVWKKFPENMLMFKAFHLCTRFHVPDALAGHVIKEELEASGPLDDSEHVESQSVPAEPTATPVEVSDTKPADQNGETQENASAPPKRNVKPASGASVKKAYELASNIGWKHAEMCKVASDITGIAGSTVYDLTEEELRVFKDTVQSTVTK